MEGLEHHWGWIEGLGRTLQWMKALERVLELDGGAGACAGAGWRPWSVRYSGWRPWKVCWNWMGALEHLLGMDGRPGEGGRKVHFPIQNNLSGKIFSSINKAEGIFKPATALCKRPLDSVLRCGSNATVYLSIACP
jgi:hypothetical protein